MYAITYTGHDQYYGRVPGLPICVSIDTAIKLRNEYPAPRYVKTLHIEHKECGQLMEYCDCHEEPVTAMQHWTAFALLVVPMVVATIWG